MPAGAVPAEETFPAPPGQQADSAGILFDSIHQMLRAVAARQGAFLLIRVELRLDEFPLGL